MKTMTCRELGGECDTELTTETWHEMVEKMTDHVMENHPKTAKKMEEMHVEDPNKWGDENKKKWDATPENDEADLTDDDEDDEDESSKDEEDETVA